MDPHVTPDGISSLEWDRYDKQQYDGHHLNNLEQYVYS